MSSPLIFDESDLSFPVAEEGGYRAIDDFAISHKQNQYGGRRFGRKSLTILIASTTVVTTIGFAGSSLIVARESLRCKDHYLCRGAVLKVPPPPTADHLVGARWLSSPGYLLSARWGADILHPDLWSNSTWDEVFDNFSWEYNKDYGLQTEKIVRKAIFKKNMLKIFNHNVGLESMDELNAKIRLAPNQFTDLLFEEFKGRYLAASHTHGLIQNTKIYRGDVLEFVTDNIPDKVDWRNQGCVTPIKDQAHCGSCWAFSATGSIEGAACAQNGKLLSLSEQQLIDCAAPEGGHGCNGGFMDSAFQYVIDNNGICAEEEYVYEGVQGECRAKKCKPVAKISGLLDLPSSNEKAILAAVALYGPVSVGIEADRPTFQFYHDGVFNLKCGKKLNHAVLIVGYGTEHDEDYWLIKNSWGSHWGDGGFMKISRRKHRIHGECGILLAPTIPLVEGRSVPIVDRSS